MCFDRYQPFSQPLLARRNPMFLVILTRRPLSYNATTDIRLMEAEPTRMDISDSDGMCFRDFFKQQGISLQRAMEEFPDTIMPDDWCPTWDSNFAVLYVDNFQRLANLMQMPVKAFVAEERTGIPERESPVFNPQ